VQLADCKSIGVELCQRLFYSRKLSVLTKLNILSIYYINSLKNHFYMELNNERRCMHGGRAAREQSNLRRWLGWAAGVPGFRVVTVAVAGVARRPIALV
jgi:hypothetical protein